MTQDHRVRIDHFELVAVLEYCDCVMRHDAHHRKDRPRRLPALGATAGMVVQNLALDSNLHRPIGASADKRPAGKGGIGGVGPAVEHWMQRFSHV
jgi:hypothetical protein